MKKDVKEEKIKEIKKALSKLKWHYDETNVVIILKNLCDIVLGEDDE